MADAQPLSTPLLESLHGVAMELYGHGHPCEAQYVEKAATTIIRLQDALHEARHFIRAQHEGVDFSRKERAQGVLRSIDAALEYSSTGEIK